MSLLITGTRIYADEKGHYLIPDGYRSDETYSPNIKAMAFTLYSEGVMSNNRIATFLNAAGGNVLGLSEGSVYHFCRAFSKKGTGERFALGGRDITGRLSL